MRRRQGLIGSVAVMACIIALAVVMSQHHRVKAPEVTHQSEARPTAPGYMPDQFAMDQAELAARQAGPELVSVAYVSNANGGPAGGAESQTGPLRVAVLLYHHLDPHTNGKNGVAITVTEFQEQMDWLKQNGYTAVTPAQLAQWLAHRRSLPAKSVVITFDDGYRSNYEYAYPILKRDGLKATIFMIASATGTGGDLPFLSWAELREMSQSGVIDVEAHSYDGHTEVGGHSVLSTWPVAQVHDDTQKLLAAFKDAGLPTPTIYAYPHGDSNKAIVETLQAAGMQLGFTVQKGYVVQGDNPFALRRFIVWPQTPLCRFAEEVTNTRVCGQVASAQPAKKAPAKQASQLPEQ